MLDSLKPIQSGFFGFLGNFFGKKFPKSGFGAKPHIEWSGGGVWGSAPHIPIPYVGVRGARPRENRVPCGVRGKPRIYTYALYLILLAVLGVVAAEAVAGVVLYAVQIFMRVEQIAVKLYHGNGNI